jgi:hypothetical protein
MKNNLVVGVLGHRKSGKSSTWNALFGREVRTGENIRQLYLTDTEYVDVFLISGSPEERQRYVSDIIGNQKPRIVLCSMQYVSHVTETLNFFSDGDFKIYIQWLNPGNHDQSSEHYFDYLGFVNQILALDSTFSIRDGKANLNERVTEIRDYIYGWAHSRGLIFTNHP